MILQGIGPIIRKLGDKVMVTGYSPGSKSLTGYLVKQSAKSE